MSFIQRFGVPLARSLPQYALPSAKTYTQSAVVALRSFASREDQKPISAAQKLFFSAVKSGDEDLVETILRTLPSVDVNTPDVDGKLPLTIAIEAYGLRDCKYDKMLTVLHDWGACYMRGKNGDFPLKHLGKLGMKPSFNVFNHTMRCGMPNSRCTNSCKSDTKAYSPEFKALVAWESLTTHLSVNDLAKRHGVEDVEVIKWRYQAREEYCRFSTRELKDYTPELEEKVQIINISRGLCKIVYNLAKEQGVDNSDLRMLHYQDEINLLSWFREALIDFFKRNENNH